MSITRTCNVCGNSMEDKVWIAKMFYGKSEFVYIKEYGQDKHFGPEEYLHESWDFCSQECADFVADSLNYGAIKRLYNNKKEKESKELEENKRVEKYIEETVEKSVKKAMKDAVENIKEGCEKKEKKRK